MFIIFLVVLSVNCSLDKEGFKPTNINSLKDSEIVMSNFHLYRPHKLL